MESGVAEKVSRLIEPLLTEMAIELVDVQYRVEQNGQILRLLIHKKTGIGLEDCAQVSREVSHLLEVEDFMVAAYHLEVSSPGLDRPLKNERDFNRNIAKEVKVTLNELPEQQITGIIVQATNDNIVINTGKEHITIPLTRITKAKLIF